MNDTTAEQFFSQVQRSQRILIALPPKPSDDLSGAGLALAMFLKKLDKEVEVACDDNFEGQIPFLPKSNIVKTNLAGSQSLAVVVDTTLKGLEEISYQQEAGKAMIFLKSRGEIFSPGDISFETQKAPYGLAVILGAQSLEDLGKIFENNTNLFFETPKINIDNHPGNKHFGSINLVDINAVSLSESLTSLLEEYETNLFDEDIATALLFGIISKTNSFQHPQSGPKSFLKASALIGAGARQQEIVKHLYRTKPLPLLKLWGRALAKIKDWGDGAATVLGAGDFEKAEAEFGLLPLVLKELANNLSGKRFVVVIAEAVLGTRILLGAREGFDQDGLIKEFGQGKEYKHLLPAPFLAWEFNLEKATLQEAEDKLKKILAIS